MSMIDHVNDTMREHGVVLIARADVKRIYALADELGFGKELRALGITVSEGFIAELVKDGDDE